VYDLTQLTAALARTPFSGHLHHFATVASSNAIALEAANAGAPTGSVWFADEQTAGRGRGGHTWLSTADDGLYVSVLLRPQVTLADALWLSLATGLAVAGAIAEVTHLDADVRWPNDILLHGKKCGGILVETAATANDVAQLKHAVIGIGINVNHESFPAEIAPLATSLRLETGVAWPRQKLLIALLTCLHAEMQQLALEQTGAHVPETLLERFTRASTWVSGKRVHVEEAGGYTGVTEGLDDRGFLRVRAADGTLRTVLTGGVREEK